MKKFSFLRPHIIFWVLLFLYETAVIFSISNKLSFWYDYFSYYALNILLFYIHAYIVQKTLRLGGKKAYLLIGLFTLLEIVGYLAVKYVYIWLLTVTGVYKASAVPGLALFFRNSIWRSVYIMGLSFAYSFGKVSIASAKRIGELDKQRLQDQINQQNLENDLLLSENAYLKAQINQHFLFNMLSFIHSNVMKYSDKIADLIISLSDLMRYAFTAPDSEGKVKLDSEIEHIENFISLNQHRFDHQLNIHLKVDGNAGNIRIISLLLVTIIENIFKYGDLQNKSYPAKIYIAIDQAQLHLHVDNSKLNRPHGHSSGIGMSNVQKRLDLVYPGNYKLNVTQDTLTYQLDLYINIPQNDLLHH